MPRYEREHDACPHCGRNTCTWHMPGRRCYYAFVDQPGEVKAQPAGESSTCAALRRQFPTPPAGKVA